MYADARDRRRSEEYSSTVVVEEDYSTEYRNTEYNRCTTVTVNKKFNNHKSISIMSNCKIINNLNVYLLSECI